MTIHTFTEAGVGHANEDILEHRQHPSDDSFSLCLLGDGQGGRAGGGQAARVGVASALHGACAAAPRTLLLPSTWLDICGLADRAVAATTDAGYCTLVGVAATPDWVVGASSGDSAAVLLLESVAINLTERQRKNPPVGSGGAMFEPFSAGLNGWWRILVMSDGVWKYVGWDQMIAIGRVTPAHLVAGALRQQAMAGTGGLLPDDFSIIVIEP